jgi:transcription elongation factor Elf1
MYIEIDIEYDIDELYKIEKEKKEELSSINKSIVKYLEFYELLNHCPICKKKDLSILVDVIDSRTHHAVSCNICNITTKYFNSAKYDIKELAETWNKLKETI